MTQESVTGVTSFVKRSYGPATWARIEKEIKSGRTPYEVEKMLKAEGVDCPSRPGIIKAAKTRGWVSSDAQASALVSAVNAGAEIIREERMPDIRQQIVDKAIKKLSLDELFREHGEGVLEEVKVALGRLRDRNVSASEASFALQRIMDGLAKLREAMEGKRPATAVQINNGAETRPREVLMVPGVMPREAQ